MLVSHLGALVPDSASIRLPGNEIKQTHKQTHKQNQAKNQQMAQIPDLPQPCGRNKLFTDSWPLPSPVVVIFAIWGFM